MDFFVDQVVSIRPPVTGGYIIAIVTHVYPDAAFGDGLEVRVTDGNAHYPTGTVHTLPSEMVSH